MRCEFTSEELSAYASGDCDASRARAIEAHLNSCASCRAQLAAFGRLDTLLGSMRRSEPSAEAILEARRVLAREPSLERGARAPEVMSLEEVAEFLRVSTEELEPIADQLPAFEIAGRIRIRRDRLLEWIDRRELVYMRRSMEGEYADGVALDIGRGVA